MKEVLRSPEESLAAVSPFHRRTPEQIGQDAEQNAWQRILASAPHWLGRKHRHLETDS